MVLAVASVGLLAPRPADAGFFSFFVRLFSQDQAEIEESLPALAPTSQAAIAASALAAENRPPTEADDLDSGLGLNVVQENSILAPLNPLGTITTEIPPVGQIFVYTVRTGDTIQGIAKSFGVSVNTILWANNISDMRAVGVGRELVILPVTGVRHEVRPGDTVAAIAKRYHAAVEDLMQFNGIAAGEVLVPGSTIIIPNGELAAPVSPVVSPPRYFASLPAFAGFYMRPIIGGRKSRGIHGYNGIDLADSCGLPVLAAADGQVLITKSSGWNGGYGRYIVITHANNTQTLYAHLKELAVAPGKSVRQGTLIGAIGSSGNSTGCHVHFEVRGARNPF